jgi:hypothetical protein
VKRGEIAEYEVQHMVVCLWAENKFMEGHEHHIYFSETSIHKIHSYSAAQSKGPQLPFNINFQSPTRSMKSVSLSKTCATYDLVNDD